MLLLLFFQGWIGGDPCDRVMDRISIKGGGHVCLLGGYACAKGGFKSGIKQETPTFYRDYRAFMYVARATSFKIRIRVGAKICLTGCYSF